MTIASVQYLNITPELRSQIEARLQVRAGDTIDNDALQRIKGQLLEIDEHLTVGVGRSFSRQGLDEPRLVIALVTNGIGVGVGRGRSGGPIAVTAGVPAAASITAPGAQRVSSRVLAANLIQRVQPEYPEIAKAARVQGVVVFDVLIGTDGKVKQMGVNSGHPMLVDPAREAVVQWEYRPTLLNGQPIEVISQVEVNFTLN
jgi:TonB family protein